MYPIIGPSTRSVLPDERAVGSDVGLGVKDEADIDIYLNVSLDRKSYAPLIESRIKDGIQAAKETIEKALDTGDILFFGYDCSKCLTPEEVLVCY